jgi:hypothetical protein
MIMEKINEEKDRGNNEVEEKASSRCTDSEIINMA